MKTKLSKRKKQKNPRIKFNLEKLNDKSIAEEFQAKIGGKFAPLLLLENVDELTEGFNAAIAEVAQEVLGKQRNKKQPWISNEALDLCDKRREKKVKRKNGPEEAEEYTNKEVERNCEKTKKHGSTNNAKL